MKRWLIIGAGLLALCLLSPAPHARLMINQLSGFGSTPARVLALDKQVDTLDETDLTTYTFSSQSMGAAHDERHMIVGVIGYHESAGRSISSVTLDGNTMTSIATASTGSHIAAIYAIKDTADTTDNVVVTFNTTMRRCRIIVWRMVGPSGVAAYDTATDTVVTVATLDIPVDIPKGGAVVAIAGYDGVSGAGASATWTNLTEDTDTSPVSDQLHTGAHDSGFELQAQRAIAVGSNGLNPTLDAAAAAASWGP